eukprot:TRINITY_DN11213_c0_g1_i1.p1 TRINITY_DN11213_c0_g1~~TRINITY_DN11213_c0_g1_i1.p1  ORF type:complete len:367 (+),score=96.51 TRINITY_DN11213_c0_g1_i1:77-1102(+)
MRAAQQPTASTAEPQQQQGWREPGGQGDPADPQLPVPPDVRLLRTAEPPQEGVTDQELGWMAAQRPLVADRGQLSRDYGAEEAEQMLQGLREAGVPEAAQGAVAWPGVGTRWRRFAAWWRSLPPDGRPADAAGALAGFARALGRVRTYRALALDAPGLERILRADEIFPHGRLAQGVDEERMRQVVAQHGVAKVAVCRLFIAHRREIGGLDPSVSLHDDWQTTSVIASGYASGGKRVHLFELSVPAVESLGWTVQDVAQRAPAFLGPRYRGHEQWFRFPAPACPQGVWFDSGLQRTERYGLYSVPALSARLSRLFAFDSMAQLQEAVAPFAEHCAAQHSRR